MKRPVCRLLLFTLLCVRCVGADSSPGPATATCSDGKWNGQETDLDCGGPVCGKCGAEKACLVDSDCTSRTCLSIKICSTPVSTADMSTVDQAPVDMTAPPLPGMIKRVVYSDTFTLGGVRRDRLYGDNSAGAYRVETSPDGAVWNPASNFSFNSPGSSTNPPLLGAALGNSGKTSNHVRMFVDRALRCDLDLNTFGGGRYRSYSKAAVGIGGNGAGATWMDNFQAGPG